MEKAFYIKALVLHRSPGGNQTVKEKNEIADK